MASLFSIDAGHCVRFISPIFNSDDVKRMLPAWFQHFYQPLSAEQFCGSILYWSLPTVTVCLTCGIRAHVLLDVVAGDDNLHIKLHLVRTVVLKLSVPVLRQMLAARCLEYLMKFLYLILEIVIVVKWMWLAYSDAIFVHEDHIDFRGIFLRPNRLNGSALNKNHDFSFHTFCRGSRREN